MQQIFLILHGFTLTSKAYAELRTVIASQYPNATILIPELKLSTFSTACPDDIIAGILQLIDAQWQEKTCENKAGDPLPEITIIGHSMSAVLARKLFIVACGENSNAPLGDRFTNVATPRPWAGHVKRIILLAGVNRGWTINAHLYTKTAIASRIGMLVGHLMKMVGVEPMAFKTRRGAPFITQMRIQWVSMLHQAKEKGVGDVPVIQLLGTKDDIISPDDNIDMLTGNNFIYLEVPESDHLTVLNVIKGDAAPKRRKVFEEAITLSPEALFKKQIAPVDDISLKIDPTVTDVVFVVHGIRDTGYWTQKIARRVKTLGDCDNRKFATETSTYGYFAMLPFLLPFVRRQKVEWLMDQYTENLVLYPNANFSFIGHSNGTYLLAKSLKEYPVCKFKNVVFAGSVVHKQYEWQQMIGDKRIESFYNLIASSDWVVAIFPKAFQTLKLQDLGSGGFDGFSAQLTGEYQLRFVKGGHGAAIEENYWDDIAHFIVHGKTSQSIASLAVDKRSFFMKALGAIAPVPFLIIVTLLLWGLWAIFKYESGIQLVLLLLVYIWAVWKIVTRL